MIKSAFENNVAFGNACAPTVLHEKHSRKKDAVAQKREKKPGEPCTVGQTAQPEQSTWRQLSANRTLNINERFSAISEENPKKSRR